MRRIVLHRRAVKYLRCMPCDRQAQIVRALEEIAAVQNLGEHTHIKALHGIRLVRKKLIVRIPQ